MNDTESAVLNFRARDWFQITGRGWAVAFDPADLVANDMWTPRQVEPGQHITIDGDPYEVRGVGSFLPFISPENPYRHSFEILVDGEPPADWPARRVAVIEPLPAEPERPPQEGTFPAVWARPESSAGEIDVHELLR